MWTRKFNIGDEVDGTVLGKTRRVIADADGAEYAVMDAVISAKNKPGFFRDTLAVRDAQVAFPIGAAQCEPFVGTDFRATIGKALTGNRAPYAHNKRVVLTFEAMETQSIGGMRFVPDQSGYFLGDLLEDLGSRERSKRPRWEFFGPSVADVLDRWRQESYETLRRNPKGIQVLLSASSSIHFRQNGVHFDGVIADLHPAARATVEFVRDRGNGVITITSGTEDYKMSVWAHAQLMDIAVIGFNPIPDRQDEAFALVDALRERYQRAKIELVQYEAPQVISNAVQMYYAQQKRQRLQEITL